MLFFFNSYIQSIVKKPLPSIIRLCDGNELTLNTFPIDIVGDEASHVISTFPSNNNINSGLQNE